MGVEGSVVDAAIGWLVHSILGSLLTDKLEAWTREVGLAGDVRRLEREMRTVETVLAAARGRELAGNEPLARSLDDLRHLLYDAEDVVDELDYYRLQREIERGDAAAAAGICLEGTSASLSNSTSSFTPQLVRSATGVLTAWASSAIDFVTSYPTRKRKRGEAEPAQDIAVPLENKRDISRRINEIASQLCIVGDSVLKILHLERSCCVATPRQSQGTTAGNARLTTSLPVEPKVYGRDAVRDEIVELLIDGNSSDLNVLPIIGNGGVGKTTVARFVYCDKRIRDHFSLRIWVCVSSNFDEVRLTREMLEHVCTDRHDYDKISSLNVLQETLMDNIRNKRFLLVLDDVWEDRDKNRWSRLLAPLKYSQVIGCIILATTRSPSVANMIGTLSTVKLNGLDNDDFWLFFKACAFGDENHEGYPSLQAIGKQIAKRLKGYPLAAQSVGALLRQNLTYEHWCKIQDQWAALQKRDNGILPILKLSYDHLPFYLQRCFSYCSLFPEDHKFDGEKLVRAWISQSFVYCKVAGNTVEEAGRQYLDRLVDLGFFQKEESHYLMHDLMHELAKMVSSNECVTIDGLKSNTIPPTILHLSIITYAYDEVEHDHFPIDKFEKELQKIRSLEKLRTLMFFGQGRFVKINLMYFKTLCKVAKSLRYLRIHLSGVEINSIWNSIKPFHLRYVELFVGRFRVEYSRRCEIEQVFFGSNAYAQALPRFYHLQALDAGSSINLAVPGDINNLVNLRHLIAGEKMHSKIANVGKMTSLQELNKFRVQHVSGFEIGQLRSMNELVTLGIFQLENVLTKEEAGGARLLDKDHLKELSLSWDGSATSPKPTTTTAAEVVLEGLHPNRNVKDIQINGYNGAICPMWLGTNLSITSLQSLHLENCSELRTIRLERIYSLGRLKLIKMRSLVDVSVPSLEELLLSELPNLERCVGTYKKELTSNIRILRMERCAKLKDSTLFQSYDCFKVEQKAWFPFLNKLSIKHCPLIMLLFAPFKQWTIIPFEEMQSLEELELIEMPGVRKLSVPYLKKLALIQMPNLECCTSLNEDRLSSCLIELQIEKCVKLTRFPVLQVPDEKEWLPNIYELTVHDCPYLTVSCPLPPSAKWSNVSVSIRGVSAPPAMVMHKDWPSFTIISDELSVLDEKIVAFNNLTGILNLNITNCPNLVSVSFQAFRKLTSLERVEINGCPRLFSPRMTLDEAYNDNTKCLPVPFARHLTIVSSGMMGEQILLPCVGSFDLTIKDCSKTASMPFICPIEEQSRHLSLLYISSNNTTGTVPTRDEQVLLIIPRPLYTFVKKLHISNCPELVLCNSKEGFAGFTCLEVLTITGCPKLLLSMVHEKENDGRIDQSCLLPPSLNQFEANHLPAKMRPYFPQNHSSLRRLSVWDSPRLKSLDLHSCKNLLELEILNCEHLSALGGLPFLSSLRILKLARNPKLSTAWEFNYQDQECWDHQNGDPYPYSRLEWLETDDFCVLTMPFCKHLTCLRHLTLSNSRSYKRLVSLSEEQERAIQQLISLQELRFLCCDDLLSLPSELHCLSSLKKLEIGYCPGISSLPQKGLPFSALEKLVIKGCGEELNKRCRLAATDKLKVQIDGELVDDQMACVTPPFLGTGAPYVPQQLRSSVADRGSIELAHGYLKRVSWTKI